VIVTKVEREESMKASTLVGGGGELKERGEGSSDFATTSSPKQKGKVCQDIISPCKEERVGRRTFNSRKNPTKYLPARKALQISTTKLKQPANTLRCRSRFRGFAERSLLSSEVIRRWRRTSSQDSESTKSSLEKVG